MSKLKEDIKEVPESKYEWVHLDDGRSIYRKKAEHRYIPKIYGQAPTVMFDSMEPEYHHGVCREISSRKEWEAADKESGSITRSPAEFKRDSENLESRQRAVQRQIQADRRKASIEAAKAFTQNKDEFYGKLKVRGEQQIKQAEKSGLTKLIKENI